MMPPHGRCSEPMSRALGAVGFDALSAIHPLPWTEQWRSGPVLVGWQPADFVGGCPVIPRMPLSCSPSDIALRAYLDHPIILYGHHQDVADGLDLLEEAARHVNRLGDVQWISAGRIAETNQERRVVGDRMAVRPYSRRLRLSVDPSVCTLVVEAPDDALGTTELAGWSLADGQLRAFGSEARLETAGAPVAVRLHGAFDVAADAVTVPGWRPWPKLRRVVTEARDRATAVRVVSSPS
jgi:hypothetical protein